MTNSAATQIKGWNTALSAVEEGINLNLDNISLRRCHFGTLIGRMRFMEAGGIKWRSCPASGAVIGAMTTGVLRPVRS
ncbi:hypothetical protein HJA91_30875 [Rhizobium binae]|nr:hypothetical protein [Rhizobium binae]QSY85902.1 hypothetical protein J2J99_30055 [Rhizobium binae]